VKEGSLTEVSILLPEENGSIYVNTTPSGAEIFTDGNQSGLSPVLVSGLVPGNHTLVARKAGYITTRQEVHVIGGQMVAAQLSLGEGVPVQGTNIPATRAAGIVPTTMVISMVGAVYLFRRLR
jgi:predicted amino acid dehydrogenase